jgi:hypothetical protein
MSSFALNHALPKASGRLGPIASGRPSRVYGRNVSLMPRPGDLITAFSPQPGRCFRMVQSRQLQATHCPDPPAWKGIWTDVKGRSWYVEACRGHAPKVAGPESQGF